MLGVEVSETTVEEVVGVEEKRRRRAAVKVEVDGDSDDDGAIDGDDDAIDHLAAKLPTFGADDAVAFVRRARDRIVAAIARAPEAAEGDIAARLVGKKRRNGRPKQDSDGREREKKKKKSAAQIFFSL